MTDENRIQELLPCPFLGCKCEQTIVMSSLPYVRCTCGALGPNGINHDSAVAAWNARAHPTPDYRTGQPVVEPQSAANGGGATKMPDVGNPAAPAIPFLREIIAEAIYERPNVWNPKGFPGTFKAAKSSNKLTQVYGDADAVIKAIAPYIRSPEMEQQPDEAALLEKMRNAYDSFAVNADYTELRELRLGTCLAALLPYLRHPERESKPAVILAEQIIALHKRWMDAGCPQSVPLSGTDEQGRRG